MCLPLLPCCLETVLENGYPQTRGRSFLMQPLVLSSAHMPGALGTSGHMSVPQDTSSCPRGAYSWNFGRREKNEDSKLNREKGELGAWVARSVKQLTLDLCSGLDLRVLSSSRMLAQCGANLKKKKKNKERESQVMRPYSERI